MFDCSFECFLSIETTGHFWFDCNFVLIFFSPQQLKLIGVFLVLIRKKSAVVVTEILIIDSVFILQSPCDIHFLFDSRILIVTV